MPPAWLYAAVGLVVWVATAGFVYRYLAWEAEERHWSTGPEEWFVALFVGFCAGMLWWFLLIIGVPLAAGLWLIWRAAMLVAHPPKLRARRRPVEVHWTDALPADTPLERVIELAEQKATERQRPNPSVRTWM